MIRLSFVNRYVIRLAVDPRVRANLEQTITQKDALDASNWSWVRADRHAFAQASARATRVRPDLSQDNPDWDALFAEFDSGVDYPVSCVWEELAAYYPEANVVLTVRAPERCWESTHSTIYGRDTTRGDIDAMGNASGSDCWWSGPHCVHRFASSAGGRVIRT